MSICAMGMETAEVTVEHLQAEHGYGPEPGQLRLPDNPLVQHAREHYSLDCGHGHFWALQL